MSSTSLRRVRRWATALVAAAAISASAHVEAQSPPPAGGSPSDQYQRSAKELDDHLNDLLAIPEVPAAFALGISVDTVAHPGTVRDAIAALTAHIGSDGTLKPGLAIEAAPFRPLFESYDVDQWKENAAGWMRVADSFRLSLATSTDPNAPAGTTAPTLAAAGMRVALIDQRDYRYNTAYIQSVRKALAICGPKPVLPQGDGGPVVTPVPVPAECSKNLTTTLDDLDKTLTLGHRLELDAAFTFAQGQPASNVDWRSAHFWLAYDYGFKSGAVGGAGDVLLHDDAAGKHVTDLSLGARADVGQSKVSWSLSALFASVVQPSSQRDKVFRYGMALAVKMTNYGVAKAGIQGSHDFDSHADGAILFVNLSAANGDTVFERAVAQGSPVATIPANP